jgi:hypothetical protein
LAPALLWWGVVLDFSVIADVSKTLESALTGTLAPLGAAAEIHDLQGPIPVAPARVTLFLFETSEDPSARNRPVRREIQPGSLVLHKPAMALDLRYLVTPWSGDRTTDHRLLGRVMQFLYDNAILSGPALQGGLAGTEQALKITLMPLALEDRTRVWHSVQKPYRLSVVYGVRVVNLVSETSATVPTVSQRTLDHAIPEATP